MASIKRRIGSFTFPALLVLVISSGVWAFLDLSGQMTDVRSPSRNPGRRGERKFGLAPQSSPFDATFINTSFEYPQRVANTPVSAPVPTPAHVSRLPIPSPAQDTSHTASPVIERVDTSAQRDSSRTPAIVSDTTLAKPPADSTAAQADTLSLDSLKLSAWLQSTRPPSQVQAQIFEPYHYPLYLYSGVIQHTATIDSTGKYVEVRETLLNNDIRLPLEIPLDEYINLQRKNYVESTWEDLAHQYTYQEKGGLSSLMAGVTNIDIPIPANPVLSIFGPPRINLQISGAVDIQGGWRNQKLNAQTLSQLGNVTNQPDFKQDVQVNVSGTVGDKLNIGANWDTQNQFDYENQLKIKYTGYNDEVVKSVEAGNVSMSTPSSFIGNNQALFGIKTQMQMGPLTLTAIASQQKAQSNTLTVSNGSSSQQFSLHAYQFATNHFFIDTMYIGGYEQYYQTTTHQYNANLYITNMEVYISQPQTAPNSNLRKGYAVIDLPAYNAGSSAFYSNLRTNKSFAPTSWMIESGKFQKLDQGSQYDYDPKTGVLTLKTSFQSNQIVAVAFSTADGQTYGTFGATDTTSLPLVLNMVVPQNPTPSMTDAWRLMLRNIYNTGGLNLDQNSLKNVQITYTPPGQPPQDNIDNINLLQIFGLDKTGANGGPPDGQLDWTPGIDIDPQSGEIIFPYLKPFVEAFKSYVGPQNQTVANPDSFTYKEIYDTTTEVAQNVFNARDRFLITGTYTSSSSSHYNLGFNLVEGSVKVLLNGQPLTAGIDYSVDYVTGEVDIKNQAALQSGANVQIQYETNDIFQIASKSLMGARADYKVNDNTDIGFTIMGFSRQSPNSKVRLGEEPISNTILEGDATTTLDLPFVTKGLDALPLIQTAAPSSITMHAEVDYMMPNPNTRTSVIPDDNNQGVAYLDDFEGAKKTIPLPITYANWTMASPPAQSVLDSLHPGIVDSVKNDYRGWAYWYNRIPAIVNVKDIWPNKQVPADQQTQTVLSVGFLPTVRGQYNRAVNLDSTLYTNPTENWGGMMTLLSSNASDLVSQNMNYIEIWMRVDSLHGPGVMHVDLGQISEDVVGDRILHTEDTTGYGGLQSGLDLGLDLMTDAQERAAFPWIVHDSGRPWDPNGNDPEGDDYYFNGSTNPVDSMYYQVNGTQGNSVTEQGRLPDTEDLNRNGSLDLLNSYFEYSVKLDTTNNPFIAGGGHNGWCEYVIPLQDYQRAVGSPSLTNVQYVRVWFNGMTANMHLQIAEMNLVGNYWQTANTNDSTMQVSVVSVEDNPDYQPPANGLRPVDNSSPTGQQVLGNEQSLDLILNGLQDDSSRYVYKTFPQAQNLFYYHTMKVFVHGDPRFNYVDSTNYDAQVYLRFGSDANNFYEYRQPVKPGWQDLVIDFARLTSLKQKRDSVSQTIPAVPAENGVPGSTYWLRGNPSLQSVTYFQIGITNPPRTGTPLPLVGQVWVDELRLTNVDNTPGMAYQFSSTVQLADLGSVSYNYTNVDPYFHSLTTQFGTLSAQRNWSISGTFNLQKFLPREWVGTAIPFYYTHNETFGNPLYLPNSDILVTEAVTRRRNYLDSLGVDPRQAAIMADSLLTSSQTLSVNDQWSISSMRIVLPSDKWYVRDIVDNITMGFNWNGSHFRNTQTKLGESWAWQYNAGYSVQLDPMAYFTPFPSSAKNRSPESGGDFQIRYLPSSLNFAMSASRSLTVNNLWTQTTPLVTPNFTTQRSGGFSWRLTNNGILNPSIDYRFNVSSSLLALETDTSAHGLNLLRPNSYVFRQIFLNGGLIDFGNDFNFSQQFALSTSPKLPFGIQRYADLQTSYNSGYQWTNSIQQGPLGKASGFSSSFQLGTNLRLKSLTDPWFAPAAGAAPGQPPERGERGRRNGREEFAPQESARDTSSGEGNGTQLSKLLDTILKKPFLDFENVSINFTSTNSSSNNGLPSLRPGMANFFRLPFIQASDPLLGPSQLYQLGLVSDPYSTLSFAPKKGFPFFSFSLGPTRRVGIKGLGITDNFSNSNTVDIKTSRNLWTGARIDLSWHVGWSYNRNDSYNVDSNGYVIPSTLQSSVSGQVSRSFFTLPPVLFLSMFKSGINQVASDYQSLVAGDPSDTKSTKDQKLSQAFVQGFETLPLLDKLFGQYFPRMNYSFSWSGLENLPLFKSFASQVSLNNAYQSTYSQTWHNTNNTGQVTDAQTISYGFQPLIGMNMALKNFGDANISGSILYNTNTQYALSPTARTITESYTGQLAITADYAKRGFSLPLFGLNLKNDIDISASYSISQTSSQSFTVDNMSAGPTPLSGTDQISIELGFKYNISQRVSARIYYKNNRVVPTTSGSPIPGTTTNEAGVEVHVSIAG